MAFILWSTPLLAGPWFQMPVALFLFLKEIKDLKWKYSKNDNEITRKFSFIFIFIFYIAIR